MTTNFVWLHFTTNTHSFYGRYLEYDFKELKPVKFGNQVDYYVNGNIGYKVFKTPVFKHDTRPPEKASCIMAKAAMDRQKLAASKDLGPRVYNLCRFEVNDKDYYWGYSNQHIDTDCQELNNALYETEYIEKWQKDEKFKDYSLSRYLSMNNIESKKYENVKNEFQQKLSTISISTCTDDMGDYENIIGPNKCMSEDIHYENFGYSFVDNKIYYIDYGIHILGENKNLEL